MAWTQNDIDAVETAIKNKILGGAIQEYSIRDRSVKHMSLGDLQKLRDSMLSEVNESVSGNGNILLADLRQGGGSSE